MSRHKSATAESDDLIAASVSPEIGLCPGNVPGDRWMERFEYQRNVSLREILVGFRALEAFGEIIRRSFNFVCHLARKLAANL